MMPRDFSVPKSPPIFLLLARRDGRTTIEAAFSKREYAEARAEVLRNGDHPPRKVIIREIKVDDPWFMPVKATPVADILKVRDLMRGYSEPIGDADE
jgi:hypothetical protein